MVIVFVLRETISNAVLKLYRLFLALLLQKKGINTNLSVTAYQAAGK
jgi:hypothetical protein